jgi:hypothetical protein
VVCRSKENLQGRSGPERICRRNEAMKREFVDVSLNVIEAKMPDTSSSSPAAQPRAQDMTSLPRMSLLLTLSSGRQISFSEGGDRAGIPVVFIPGVSGNRLWTAIYDELAREHGIRFITFDRPGRGVSQPPKSLKEWSFQSWGGRLLFTGANDDRKISLFVFPKKTT